MESGGVTTKGRLFEILVKPGSQAILTFTATRSGTFEFACLIAGHYERGQKGKFTVR